MNKKKAKGAKLQNKKLFRKKWDAKKAADLLHVTEKDAVLIHSAIHGIKSV